jgi:murein L,D-transpeptidase YcbB/YkuD
MAMDAWGGVPHPVEQGLAEEMRGCLSRAKGQGGQLDDSLKFKEHDIVSGIYGEAGDGRFWIGRDGLKVSAKELCDFIDDSRYYGLFPGDYHNREIRTLRKATPDSPAVGDEARLARMELLMTDAFVRLVRHIKVGRIPIDTGVYGKPADLDAAYILHLLHRKDAGESVRSVLESQEPKHPDYLSLRSALRRDLDSTSLRAYTYVTFPQRDSLRFVRQLQTRLYEDGYISSKSKPADSLTLSKAIRKAQTARRLTVDGKPGKELVRSLNNTGFHRFQRVAVNLDRYKMLPDPLPMPHVWVNLPSYLLQFRDSGKARMESRVIVGTPSSRTPVIISRIDQIVTYPNWTVPFGIAVGEMLPRVRSNPGYLTSRNFMVIDRSGRVVNPYAVDWGNLGRSNFPYTFRQRPGGGNSLGAIKFNFPNKHSVYLHDTNARGLYAQSYRSLSHGCVRVQNWKQLAEMMLKANNQIAKADSLNGFLDRKQQRYVQVERPIPVYLVYFTAYTKVGRIQFHDDIYGDDREAIERNFNGRSL